MNEGIQQLTQLYQNKDWFSNVGIDQYGRYVVYVKRMNHETLHSIPDTMAGKTVLVHFAEPPKDKFVQQINLARHYFAEPEEDQDALQRALDRLELICGSHVLLDIFGEIQDGKNAITNMSDGYPQVRQQLEVLFDQYGIDVLHDAIEQFETLPHYE